MRKTKEISRYLAEIGRRGGQAKVPKGTAMLSPEERKARARMANNIRWKKKRGRKKAA